MNSPSFSHPSATSNMLTNEPEASLSVLSKMFQTSGFVRRQTSCELGTQTHKAAPFIPSRSHGVRSLLFRHSVICALSLKAMMNFEKTHTFNSVSSLIDKNIHTLPPPENRHEYMRNKRSFKEAAILLFSCFLYFSQL